jgi:hypothetical protein
MAFPLAAATPSSLGLDTPALDRLQELITRHLAEGRYPGAQIALARDGKLALFRTFGDARMEAARTPARDDSLWLLYSNTKVITASAISGGRARAGLRGQRQGRHHDRPAPEPPGRVIMGDIKPILGHHPPAGQRHMQGPRFSGDYPKPHGEAARTYAPPLML